MKTEKKNTGTIAFRFRQVLLYIVCVFSLTHIRYKHLDLVKYMKNLVSARLVGHCCQKKLNEVSSL